MLYVIMLSDLRKPNGKLVIPEDEMRNIATKRAMEHYYVIMKINIPREYEKQI